ncbi:hypothetical protein PVA44_05465 [Entomospira nematocerorum]|uniref:Uncharacterized protein n=1 Tax=Entomospira nematocerorum TaxID=2719987 RepID=A0A968KSK5_9SPIO|nr:hypothetical protein [Entomospira nematocera]NIZ46531.1 hypothetical protein [Entomospira nematocera]WDI33670.1 hypothetical protein PVA44_05465 [Entomospira nematocera]
MLKRMLLISKSIMQAVLTTFSLMVILNVLQGKLMDFLAPLNPESLTVIVGNALTQLLLFTILAMPFALISHFVLKYLYKRQIIDTSLMPYVIASSIVIICVLITLHTPVINSVYIMYVLIGSEMMTNQFYLLAISYLIISVIFRILSRRS